MSIRILWFIPLVFAINQTHALDKGLAESLAKSAAALHAQGNLEKAKELLFSALANDGNCGLALYEMSIIFEKEGKNTAAGEFLNRAILEFKKDPNAYGPQLVDGQRRIRRLNPFAERYAQLMASYAMEIADIAKKQPDALTQAEALKRSKEMNFLDFVTEDKLVHIRKPVTESSMGETTRVRDSRGREINSERATSSATNVPFDVERELKQAGWETITGTWKKVGSNTYEVTDGVLTANKTNGVVAVIVHRGTARVSALVRAKFTPYSGPRSSSVSSSEYFSEYGYGLRIEGSNVHRIEPYSGYMSSNYRPYNQGSNPITENFPKNILSVDIAENKMNFNINNKRVRSFTYAINQDGPFMIRVEGTATIETPVARGQ